MKLDQAERDTRHARAIALAESLTARSVDGVVVSFVDNAGINRVKSVPLHRLPALGAWGVGSTPAFDRFGADDSIAAASDGSTAIGDLRLMPDLSRLVVLEAQPGWAWAPADRYSQDGTPHPGCSRLLLRRVTQELGERGLSVRAAFEIEWVVAPAGSDGFVPGFGGAAYGMSRLIEASDYLREVLRALAAQGVSVEQAHPEYAPGQLEISVAAESPVGAADTSVLVRQTIRAVGLRCGLRTSFSPKVATPGVGNGGHVHVSLWRDEQNLLSGGDGPHGLSADGQAFGAGILSHLSALLALGAPSVASYLRLVPSHWAGDFACWGLENREAAMRMVAGAPGSGGGTANLELKSVDLTANPYLLLAGMLTAGLAGVDSGATLPEPVEVDPGIWSEAELAERGIVRLPGDLGAATDAFEADDVLTASFGAALVASIVAVRRAEVDAFEAADEAVIAAALRWSH